MSTMRAFILLAVCFAYGNADGLTQQKGLGNDLSSEPGVGGGGPIAGGADLGGVGGPGGSVGPGGPGGPGGAGGVGGGPLGPSRPGIPGGAGGLGGVGGIGGGALAPSSGGDLFMLLIHQTIQVNGMDPMRIPNQQLPFSKKFLVRNYRGVLHTYNTVMYGLHNLVRTGPCFVTVDDSGMRLGLNLGIRHVFVNSSATIKFNSGEKHKVRVLVYVRAARAVLEIAQVSPTSIRVTNFRIKVLKGFDLRIRPVGQVPRAFRSFLRAVQAFVELTVKRRLEPIVRDAINVQIKRLLYELSEQARLKPRPQDIPGLPPRSQEDILPGGGGQGQLPGGQSGLEQNKL